MELMLYLKVDAIHPSREYQDFGLVFIRPN
jgi:hypothetical protein